jgi:general secretion pathway protein G
MLYNRVIRRGKEFYTGIKAHLRPDKSGLSLTGFTPLEIKQQGSSNLRKCHRHFLSLTGFTFIELVVVLAVVIVLTGILLPQVNRVLTEARIAKAKADLEHIKSAMLAYKEDVGELPPAGGFEGNLTSGCSVEDALLSNDSSTGWNGPYMDSPFTNDPWGNAYIYDDNDGSASGQSGEISYLLSKGPDGTQNTTNPNRSGTTAGGDDIYVIVFNDGIN